MPNEGEHISIEINECTEALTARNGCKEIALTDVILHDQATIEFMISNAVDNNDWHEAAELCAELINKKSQNTDVLIILAYALTHINNFDKANIVYNHIHKIISDKSRQEELFTSLLNIHINNLKFSSPHARNDALLKLSLNFVRSKEHIKAITALKILTDNGHGSFEAYILLGDLYEVTKNTEKAIIAYSKATEIIPGHAYPFTKKAVLKFRSNNGTPIKSRKLKNNTFFIQLPHLGSDGRFGNQLLQYGLGYLCAKKLNYDLITSDWIGRDLFGLDDPYTEHASIEPILQENEVLDLINGRRTANSTISIKGYFCGATTDWLCGKETFKEIFKPSDKILKWSRLALAELKPEKNTIIAIHLRRGDFGSDKFWIAPSSWYLAWLKTIWPITHNPVLYIATDDISTLNEFDEYNPLSSINISEPLTGAEFFLDHWIMQNSDILATSNSTFSITAALLNTKTKSLWRPDPKIRAIRQFRPWEEPILI